MKKNIFKSLSLSIGSIAAVTTPVVAAISCGSEKEQPAAPKPAASTSSTSENGGGSSTGSTDGDGTPQTGSTTQSNQVVLDRLATEHFEVGSKVWEDWKDDVPFNGADAQDEMKNADDSALHYIVNEPEIASELKAVTNTTAKNKLINGTKRVISYYADEAFANNRVEFEIVNKVVNKFKIRGHQSDANDSIYTNENRKVDVYGYEVVGTGANNRIKLIGSSVPALAHAFYLYVKQQHYGVIDWADASGSTWDEQHHSIHDFKRPGNSLRIPGTKAGRDFGSGEELAAASRVVARSPYQQHFNFNNVTSAYTMNYWGKSQWEAELNWLAVHGYDLILDPVGTEAVQYNVWKKAIGYTDDAAAWAELRRYFTGPAFASWQRKGNMTNYDVFQSFDSFKRWNDKQVELQRFIVQEAKKRGIDTIAMGFSGFVPQASTNKTLHFDSKELTYSPQELYTTHWSMGNPSRISHTSVKPHGEVNAYNGYMLDPSIKSNSSTSSNPITGYQLIGNALVKEYERLILQNGRESWDPNGEKQMYFNEDPFDEMHPMKTHASNNAPYTHDLFNTPGLTGKHAFLSDLGYGLRQATLATPGHENAVVTNISWQYTYVRSDWDRRSVQKMIVGHDPENPNFTPDNYLILALGEDWTRMSYGQQDGYNYATGQKIDVVNRGDFGYDWYKDGYSMAYYAGFQDYEDYKGQLSQRATDDNTSADLTRGISYDYDKPRKGGGSFAYVPLVCLGSINLPDGELPGFASGLSNVFYNIDRFPGGKANVHGKRPLLDNFRAYGPGMEGFEQNAIIYETIADMGWRQEPFHANTGAAPQMAIPKNGYETEAQDNAIFKAYLANYAWNRYGFNDKEVADFLYNASLSGGIYGQASGNPRHAFQFSFTKQNDPWKTISNRNATKIFNDYKIFQKVVQRHQDDQYMSQLFKDDLNLYAMDFLGVKVDEILKNLKSYLDGHRSQIQVKNSAAWLVIEDYRKLLKWAYNTMDRLMADTTLWRLERWVKMARNWGESDAEKLFYESDSKRLLTVWGPDCVSDYAARAWQGLLKYQGLQRDYALQLFERGRDLASEDHVQYEYAEATFESKHQDADWYANPFIDAYGKALEIFTIVPILGNDGRIAGKAEGIQSEPYHITISGTKEQFTNSGDRAGIHAQLNMKELIDLQGKFVKLELVTDGAIHINDIFFNDVTGVNKLLMNVNKDLAKGTPLAIQLPKDILFDGGNNGDLTLAFTGQAKDGQELPSSILFKLTPTDGPNQFRLNSNIYRPNFGTAATINEETKTFTIHASGNGAANLKEIKASTNVFDKVVRDQVSKDPSDSTQAWTLMTQSTFYIKQGQEWVSVTAKVSGGDRSTPNGHTTSTYQQYDLTHGTSQALDDLDALKAGTYQIKIVAPGYDEYILNVIIVA